MIALVTSQSARSLDTDLPLLTNACDAIGVRTEVVAWDDDAVDWSRFDIAIIRSTWDYHRRLDDFETWLNLASSATTLWNPVDLVRWNIDKRYLGEVATWGVPIVPTEFIAVNGDADRIALDGDIVVKPSVGAGANGACRFTNDPYAAASHARSLIADGGAALVQPYLARVDTAGETGVVVIGGEVSHAFEKGPILTGTPEWSDGLYVTERIDPRRASAEELALVDVVLSQLPPTAYARIDLLPTGDGPVISEIELIEPSLFLHVDDGAAERAAAGFARLPAR